MSDRLIYLYAVTDSPDAPPETRALPVRALFATLADVPAEEFSQEALQKNFSDLAWIERYARRHESVIDALMQRATVVPCRFPTLFYSEPAAADFVQQNYDALAALLEKLRGKAEWGIKIYAQPDRLRDALATEPALQALDAEIAAATPGKAFLLKKRRQELLEELLLLRWQDTAQRALARLQTFAVEMKFNSLLPKEATERDDEMILNAALLIETSKTDAFLEETERLQSELSAQGILLEPSGAWAAYNFCALPRPT